MRTTRYRVVALAIALVVAVAACGGGGDDDEGASTAETTASTTEPAQDGQMDEADPEIEEPITPEKPEEMAEEAEEEPPADADDVMLAAALDVEAFWGDTYEEVYGEPYEEIAGGFWTYGPDTPDEDLPSGCDITTYDDIAVNAFYCSETDLIAWDREGLIEPFIEQFGAFTAAVVMAHEFGHAIQARTGDFTSLEQVISELQADCFAGAWVAHVIDGGSEDFQADVDELDLALAGLLDIRDAPGSSPDDPSAHGSGFDRASAFSDGLSEGAQRCAAFGEEPPVVVQEVFESDEEVTGGNLPAEELLPLLFTDLEAYYETLFSDTSSIPVTWTPVEDALIVDPSSDEVTCGGGELAPEDLEFASYYCVDENVVVLDGTELLPALEEIGDFALGAELARQWAFAAQVQLGYTGNSKEELLNADCLTGLYAGDIYFDLTPTEDGLRLSPGDLDEAIISFLAFGGDAESGTPFERTAAFRTGFLGSYDDCLAILEG